MKKFGNILVAFDLNKTLFYKSESPLPRMHDKKIKKLFFYLRPHLKELVEFLHSYQINYCFWSNMIEKNCVKYVKELEILGMKKYCAILDQSFCDKAQNMEPVGEKINTIKNLNKLAQLFEIDVNHCILVDDSKQKNVEGCNLIHVNSYEGQQADNQILIIIEKIRQFRNLRVNGQEKILPMLKFTSHKEFTFKAEIIVSVPSLKEEKAEKTEKIPQRKGIDLETQKNPQLRKFKADLVEQKQKRKKIIAQIQLLQKSSAKSAEQIKKQSQGKTLKKGDQMLLQVLMYAKNKKATQKQLEELHQKKKTVEQRIAVIKKLMKSVVEKLNAQEKKNYQEETKPETPSQILSKKETSTQNFNQNYEHQISREKDKDIEKGGVQKKGEKN